MSHFESMEARRLFSFTITDTVGGPPIPAINPDRFVRAVGNANGEFTFVEVSSDFGVKLSKTGTLFVQGTSNRDRIAVKQSEGVLQVTLNGVVQAQLKTNGIATDFAANAVKRINVRAGAGRDLITVQVADKVKTNVADSTGKDQLTRFSVGQGISIVGEPNQTPTAPLPVSLITPTSPDNKILWGQAGYTIVSSAPAGVTPLNSLSHITQSLTFEATPDLLARFVLQADGSYRAYAYDHDQNIVEMTVYDYTGILVAPTQPPLLTSAGQ